MTGAGLIAATVGGGGVTFGTAGAIFGTMGVTIVPARAGATNVVSPSKLTADNVVMRINRPVILSSFQRSVAPKA
jgi:hypothetical protein